MFLIVIAAVMLGYGAAYVASDDVRYITRAGLEETRILQLREPIAEVVNDPDIDSATRAQLHLVLESRDFAAQLGLEAGGTYRQYTDVGRDTLLLVLSAAPKDCICPYTWKYPIVGRMPYKGFFDTKMAQKEADRLAARGYDVYLRPAAAFSTLGWFEDPLLSTAVTRDSVEMAALVFHEIAHNTLYVKSATPFNESFAQLVGYRSAEEFFRGRGDSALAARAADRWHDEIVLEQFYVDLIRRLEEFYATRPSPAALDSGRTAIAAWAREQLSGPYAARFRTLRLGRLRERPINNAQLVGIRIYRTHLDWFDAWYRRHDASVRTSVGALRGLMEGAEGDSAFARLGGVVGGGVADSAGMESTGAGRP